MTRKSSKKAKPEKNVPFKNPFLYGESLRKYIWKYHNGEGFIESTWEKGKYANKKILSIPLFENSKSYDQYEGCVNHYFSSVFHYIPIQKTIGLSLSEISLLVIPEDKYQELLSIIKEYNLEKHTDILLYLVAKAQDVYINEIEFYELPKEIVRLRKLKGETKKLSTAIEKANRRFNLDQIQFRFADSTPVVNITDSHLIQSIVEAFIQYWGKGSKQDWKKHLGNFPALYNDSQFNKQFRPSLAHAFHSFFTEQALFKLEGKNILDKEAYCIAQLMKAAGIPLYNKKGELYHFKIDKANIISRIKTWCNRK